MLFIFRAINEKRRVDEGASAWFNDHIVLQNNTCSRDYSVTDLIQFCLGANDV